MYHSRIKSPGSDAREQLSRRVHQLRVQHALTQTELAKAAGVGRATIARIEGGAVTPQLRTIRSLAETLHVDPRELTTGLEQLWAPDADPRQAVLGRP